MKRITAIVLSALLLITTFLSVPFITMAEQSQEVSSTTVDFNEDFYVDTTVTVASGTTKNYEYTNGTYPDNKTTIAYANLETDPEKGNVIKLSTIGSNATDNSGKWASGFRVADDSGKAPFYVKPGKSYLVSYDIKVVSAESDFSIALTNITQWNGVGGVSGGSTEYYPYTAIKSEEATATNGWVKRQDILFTPSWANDYSQLAFFLRKEGSTKYNCEVYIDNIVVTEFIDTSATYYTNINFNESIYSEGTLHNGTTIVTDDSTHGNVIKVTNFKNYNTSENSGKWPSAFRVAADNGIETFLLKTGKKYKITYDVKNLTGNNVDVRVEANNGGLGNRPVGTLLHSIGAGETEWTTKTTEYTVTWSEDTVLDFIFRANNRLSDTNGLFLDNIIVSEQVNISYPGMTDTTGLDTTAFADEKYEELAAPAAENFAGWYLDAALTEPATGVIDANAVSLYAKYYCATSIDFEEVGYEGTSLLNGATIVTDDDAHGKVLKATNFKHYGSGNDGKWPQAFRAVAENGTDAFIATTNKTYVVTYDVKNMTGYAVDVRAMANNGGLGNAPHGVLLNSIGAAETAWTTKTATYTVSWSEDSTFDIIFRANSKYTNTPGLFIDNVTICEATTLTVNANNGETAQNLTVSPVATFDSLTTPSYAGYEFAGWYLDEELTVPATGKIRNTTAVWAKWEVPAKTVIDFNESVYTDGTNYFIYNHSLATDYNVAGDNALKIVGYRSMWQGWQSATTMANNNGDGAFTVAKDGQYIVKFDMKRVKADHEFGIYMFVASSIGNIRANKSNANATDQWVTAHQKLGTLSAASGETDYTTYTYIYTAPADGNAVFSLISTDSTDYTPSENRPQEIYVDNISIEKVATHSLTLHQNNGAADRVVQATQLTEVSSISVPTKEDHIFAGWFTDAALTQAAPETVGDITDLYAKWTFIPSVNVIDFNEAVYTEQPNNFFTWWYPETDTENTSSANLATDVVTNGNKAGYLIKARQPAQGWHSVIRLADFAGTGGMQMKQGETYTVKFDIKREYAERDFNVYMYVSGNASNIKPNTTAGRKISSQTATTYGDSDFVTVDAGIFVAPANGNVYIGLAATAYPDIENIKVYFDNIVIEKMKSHDITLHTNNGQADQDIKVSLMQDFFTIAAPTRSGYIFAGWYTDEALTQPFEYSEIDANDFNVTDLYAKWQVAKEEGYSASFGFESDEFAYGNSGAETDTVNNATEKDAYVSTTDEEPYDGNGILVLSTATGNHSDAADHWASAALIDKDGNYFHTVKGTRYKLTFTMRSSGETSGTKYFYIGNSANVPTGGVNSSNSSAIFSATTGSIDFPKDTYWFTKEVYFVAEKTEKVYLSAYSSTGNAYISFDEVSFEVADDSKTALVQWYNEDGTSLVHSALGATGEMMYSLPAAQTKTGYDFNGWRIGSSTGEQWISNLYPEDDLKLYASWVESKAIPENPVSPLDENDSIFIDFENINAAKAFYEESGNTTGPSYGLFMVSNDPDNAHSGSSYFRYYRASQWTKQWYRKMRFFDQNSPDGKVWLEPYTTYKISYWYNPDTVGASNLYLANFNDEYPDGYEILAENYLNDASIFEQFGKWNYYEATVFTGDYKGELGFVLYGGYFTVSIDDITVTKCKEVDLSFQVNGGSEVETISGMSHHTFIAPEDPTKEGYIFAGWYTDSALTKPFDFTTDTVDKAMTLYAKWDVKKYRTVVTYEENEVEVEVTPEDAHLDDAALFNDTNDKIGSISPDIVEEAASLAWLWILLAVLGGLILVAAIVLLIIILAKKRKKKEA